MAVAVAGVVTQIQRYSVNDGPGIRTTVFLKGCPLRCPWCHNPETIDYFPEIFFRDIKCIKCGKCKEACPIPGAINGQASFRIDRKLCIRCMKCTEVCPSGALVKVGEMMTTENVMKEVVSDLPFYNNSGGGMTISGGEPMAQVDFTAELLKAAQRQGIHTCLDTNGYATSSAWKKVLPYLNLILYDLKHMDPDIHRKFTGISNEVILANARQLASEVKVRLRIPLIPGFNVEDKFIEEVGNFAHSIGVKACDILPYHSYSISKYIMLGKEDNFYKAGPIDDEKINKYREQLERKGLGVTIGG